MRFFKKLLLILPLVALTLMFLYGRKQKDISKQNQEEQNIKPVESTVCEPCIENAQKMSYDQGYSICADDLPKAYNAPGRIDVCGNMDVFITASFIYWEALGDQLDLGILRFGDLEPEEFKIVKFNNEYKPGFKVGLDYNLNHDNWDLFTQYTRFHSSTSTTYILEASTSNNDTFQTLYFMSGFNSFIFKNFNSGIKANWITNLDKIDLELARSYYVGTNLIFRPFLGGSVHWLDEKYNFSFIYQNTLYFANIKTNSWAIGPRIGLASKWLFYEGFSIFGQGAYNLLYCSNETSGSGSENSFETINYKLDEDEQNILRDVTELLIGFSWGSYFTQNKWHLDLALSYEAQKYSHTNYMSRYAQEKSADSNAELSTIQVKPGDTFLHGLTFTARVDF